MIVVVVSSSNDYDNHNPYRRSASELEYQPDICGIGCPAWLISRSMTIQSACLLWNARVNSFRILREFDVSLFWDTITRRSCLAPLSAALTVDATNEVIRTKITMKRLDENCIQVSFVSFPRFFSISTVLLTDRLHFEERSRNRQWALHESYRGIIKYILYKICLWERVVRSHRGKFFFVNVTLTQSL